MGLLKRLDTLVLYQYNKLHICAGLLLAKENIHAISNISGTDYQKLKMLYVPVHTILLCQFEFSEKA